MERINDETSQTSRKILYQWEELLSSPSLSVRKRNARKLQTKTERHVSLRKSLWHWWSSQLMVSVCIRAHFTAVASILLVHKTFLKIAAAGLRDLAIQEHMQTQQNPTAFQYWHIANFCLSRITNHCDRTQRRACFNLLQFPKMTYLRLSLARWTFARHPWK